VIHLLLEIDEAANFVFVQLTEQEPGVYDKRHSDCARRDKTDLAWERIPHETRVWILAKFFRNDISASV
jgi:hypothetical protein